jgi:hypothetical protein
MTNPTQGSPYLRQQWQFPFENLRDLSRQVDQAYIDIALKVNARTIGVFALNTQTVTGERWNISGSAKEQQSLRKVFMFSDTTSIPHGINFSTVSTFSSNYGAFLDTGGNWNGLIFGSSSATSIPGQISFYLDSVNINFVVDAAAPTLDEGTVVLTWLSQF